MKTKSKPFTPGQLVARFGTSRAQRDSLSLHLIRNAKSLWDMHDKAIAAGKKVNGYTAEELEASARDYEWRASEVLTCDPDYTPWKPEPANV